MATAGPIAVRSMAGTTCTIRVKVTRELRFRLWLASRLMKLAYLVLGARVDLIEWRDTSGEQ